MPERKAGEPLNAFISRFVSNERMKRKYPLKQRLAVGYSEARAAASKRKSHG